MLLILQSIQMSKNTIIFTQSSNILCHSVLKERLYFLKALDLFFKDMI